MQIDLNDLKIQKMSQKYRKFKAKEATTSQQNRLSRYVSKTIMKSEYYWSKIIPYCIRGYKNQFQHFNAYWKKQTGKDCSNDLISKNQIEQVLQKYKEGDPIAIGFTYQSQDIKKIITFVESLDIEENKRNLILCPINLEGRKYKQQIQHKITLSNEEIIVLWRGLFNQIIILNRYRLNEMNFLKNIKKQIDNRVEYQNKIRDYAQKFRDGDSKSQLFI